MPASLTGPTHDRFSVMSVGRWERALAREYKLAWCVRCSTSLRKDVELLAGTMRGAVEPSKFLCMSALLCDERLALRGAKRA